MKVTPLDLRQAQFRSKLRGFDPDEVTPFLSDAAYELEQALKEIDRLRQEAAKTEVVLDEFRERENALRNTLLTAQRLADQIKENAEVGVEDHPARGREPRRPAPAEGAGPPHRARSRHQRDARAPPRRREVAGNVDCLALLRARLHAHAGSPVRPRREAPAAPPEDGRDDRSGPDRPPRVAAARGRARALPPRGCHADRRMPPVLVRIRVIPRARRTEISGRRGDAILVRLAAPPVDGAANDALIAFLADRLGIPQRQIAIARGARLARQDDRRRRAVGRRDRATRLGTVSREAPRAEGMRAPNRGGSPSAWFRTRAAWGARESASGRLRSSRRSWWPARRRRRPS